MANNSKSNHLGNQNKEAIEGFKRYLINDRKRNETVKSYVTSAKSFLKLIDKPLKSINKEDLIKWKEYCHKYGNNSLTQKYGSIKKFIDYLIDEGILKEEFYGIVLRTLKAPKIQTDESNLDKLVLKKEELNKLFEESKKRNYRDYAIFKVAFWCQLRRIETLGLNISDIDFKNKTLRLRAEITKGGKPATIEISQDCLDIIQEYINNYRPDPSPEHKDALFIYENRRLSKTKLWEMVATYRIILNLPDFHFHMMRHTGITFYAKIQKDVKIIQNQARHSDPETTMRYINYTKEEHKSAYREFERTYSNSPPSPPKKPEIQDNPKVIKDSDIELRVKELELQLANRNAEIELLKLREKQNKPSEPNYYG